MANPPVAIVTAPVFQTHDPGPGHPESAARLTAIQKMLDARDRPFMAITSREATAAELARVHTPEYVETILATRGRPVRLDPDTATSPGSVDAALMAAGGAIEMVRAITDGRARRGFAFVRPPGHHAEPAHAMGFCIFNNIAAAAAWALAEGGLKRVLIVDWDVHHGNGTQSIFWDDPRVLFISTHQFPFYPGTGALTETGGAKARGYTINIPLPPGMGDTEYRAIFDHVVVPVALEFQPDLILVSAGFDAHMDDPLAQMEVSTPTYGHMCRALARVADICCGGRIALILEGGYNLRALAAAASLCLDVLEDREIAFAEPPDGELRYLAEKVLIGLARVQAPYWQVFPRPVEEPLAAEKRPA